MKKLIALILFTLTSLNLSAKSGDPIVVVVNQSSTLQTLTKHELIDIFMGNTLEHYQLQPIDQGDGSPLKKAFYKKLVNRSEAQIRSYWARLLFSARVKPPEQVQSATDLNDLLDSNSRSIGYMHQSDLQPSMKVVYRFEIP